VCEKYSKDKIEEELNKIREFFKPYREEYEKYKQLPTLFIPTENFEKVRVFISQFEIVYGIKFTPVSPTNESGILKLHAKLSTLEINEAGLDHLLYIWHEVGSGCMAFESTSEGEIYISLYFSNCFTPIIINN